MKRHYTLICFLFLSICSQAQTNYYSQSTGNLNALATWGTSTDGTGSSPADFTSASQIFNVRNNAAPTIASSWTVSGTGSKVIIGDGTNACTFTIPSGITYSSLATDINNNGKVKNQNV